jgi:Cu(I)/Ag(I) efflux system membrane fusion protein
MSSPTFRKTALYGTALLVVAGMGAGAWWLGMSQGMSMMAAPEAVAQASDDPSQWTIPQGEEATRRHIRDGIKAGALDPVTGRAVLNYHDPMVPGKNFDSPAKSPFMDMMLVPRYAGAEGADTGTLTVSPRIQQNLGLRTAVVTQGALTSEISATGSVVWNERDQVLVQARATGFVEKLFVRAELDRVAKGAPVAEIYVPAWIAAQEEYLALTRMQGADLAPLRDAARQRMQLAGMNAAQVEAVVKSGQLLPRFTLRSPIAGTVTELMLREGATVMSGQTLMRVQGTATVWAEGEVPESQAAFLKPGAAVTASSPVSPGELFEGKVQALLPEVNTATRTIKARMELRNPSGRLVPGMLVQMRFTRPSAQDTLLVPSDAVIHTGRRSVVMLAEDGGRFRPVDVKTGQESGGQTEVVSGLQAGQAVVRSGNFLIDSEASLRGLEAKLNQEPASAAAMVYSTGAVIDELAGNTVTLTHPPIPALKWPQMQMDFLLPARGQQPRSMAAGDRVEIEFRMQEGDMPQITRIQVVAPEPAK